MVFTDAAHASGFQSLLRGEPGKDVDAVTGHYSEPIVTYDSLEEAQAYTPDVPDSLFVADEPAQEPVHLTSNGSFGAPREDKDGQYAHRGIDIAMPLGEAVTAFLAGEVEFTGWEEKFGNTVKIRLPNGDRVIYAHLSSFAEGLKAGDKAGENQEIGSVGITGNASNNSDEPHLHLQMPQ